MLLLLMGLRLRLPRLLQLPRLLLRTTYDYGYCDY